MSCRSGESNCEVKYELEATVQKRNTGIFSSNQSAKQPLHIDSVPTQPSTSRHLPLEYIPVKKCCCHGKGKMGLEVKINRTVAQPQDTVQVEFRCQNQSSVKVKSLVVQLDQITEWRCHGHQKTVHEVLDQRVLHEASQYLELRSRKQRRRQEQFGPSSQEEGALLGGWRTSQLQIPSQSQDSYSGCNLQVRHVLSVKLQTKGCCTTNPEASALVHIYRNIPRTADNTAANPLASATVTPSAPSDYYDSHPAVPLAPASPYEETPIAEAEALPPDWNAQTAEVVNIPMAEAIVLEPGNKHYS